MSISSSLDLFLLPELFRIIEEGKKTGRLIVQIPLNNQTSNLKRIYYLWFREGYLVAISDRLNHRGLITLIETRNWLSPLITEKLRTLCPTEMPLGVYLDQMKLLTRDKLRLIFQLQLHQVYQLFELTSGWFRFDELSELQDRLMTLPWLEMTGHRMKATEVAMYGLRLVKDWRVFGEQLPKSNLALQRTVNQPFLKLISLERKIWEQADRATSIETMALELMQPIKNIQIAAFRLIVVGLLEEVLVDNYGIKSTNLVSSSKVVLANVERQKFLVKPRQSTDKSLLNNLFKLWRS
ncbi:hypothetical protein Sta7437_1119 [Stanieria cyanosphaera PCC 7437]|uniref:PatA-like N-terminal domain-containing protein n=1 Tax=Stanieria cyanosphaera (strain ATCC 29371 / PCC 7437) TaxID=111780 RepID=K9XQA0_STAC7|nr:DUF4388 domain-containing protein [Stanieria cyanosphaera]AFZ34693.1 hypothetical protein Sta7437_1119 [Stanieria cyanosphaera PCC 7437]